MTTTAADATNGRSRLLPQGVGVVADLAAVTALLAGGGRPIVWAASAGAVLAGSWLVARRLGQPLDRAALVGLGVAVAGAGILGYALRPAPPPAAPQAAVAPSGPGGVAVPVTPAGRDTAATRPSVTWLADLPAVDGGAGWRHGPAVVAGKRYERSVIGSTCSATDDMQESFELGRRFGRFRTTAGVADDAPDDYHTRFEVLLDGKVVFTRDLRIGDDAAVDLPVTGRGRLSLKVTSVDLTECHDSAVWIDPSLR
jgi:hypothetical protein